MVVMVVVVVRFTMPIKIGLVFLNKFVKLKKLIKKIEQKCQKQRGKSQSKDYFSNVSG
jgi:hypothetical protein